MQELYKSFLKEYINPYFKSIGFKCNKSNYTKDLNEHSIIFNLQKNRFNWENSTSFTFNIGINIFDYFKLCDGPQNLNDPKVGTFWFFNRRLGWYLPEKGDKWYTIGRELKYVYEGEKANSFENIDLSKLTPVENNNIDLDKIFEEIKNDINYILSEYPFSGTIEEILLSLINIQFSEIYIYKYLVLYSIDRNLDHKKTLLYFEKYNDSMDKWKNNCEKHNDYTLFDEFKDENDKFTKLAKKYLKI